MEFDPITVGILYAIAPKQNITGSRLDELSVWKNYKFMLGHIFNLDLLGTIFVTSILN